MGCKAAPYLRDRWRATRDVVRRRPEITEIEVNPLVLFMGAGALALMR